MIYQLNFLIPSKSLYAFSLTFYLLFVRSIFLCSISSYAFSTVFHNFLYSFTHSSAIDRVVEKRGLISVVLDYLLLDFLPNIDMYVDNKLYFWICLLLFVFINAFYELNLLIFWVLLFYVYDEGFLLSFCYYSMI